VFKGEEKQNPLFMAHITNPCESCVSDKIPHEVNEATSTTSLVWPSSALR